MLVLGIILILLAAGAVLLALLAAPAETLTFELGAFSLEMNTVGVFFTGAGAVVLLALGLEMIRSGVRRANRRRKEKKELQRLSRQSEDRGRDRTTGGAGVADTTSSSRSSGTSPGATSSPTDPGTTRDDGPTRGGGTVG